MICALRRVDQLSSIQTTPPHSTPRAGPNAVNSIIGKDRAVTSELVSVIQETNDTEYLEELLNVNYQLLNLLKEAPRGNKPILSFKGLGVASVSSDDESDGKLDGTPQISGRPSDCIEESSEASSVEGFEILPAAPKGKSRGGA